MRIFTRIAAGLAMSGACFLGLGAGTASATGCEPINVETEGPVYCEVDTGYKSFGGANAPSTIPPSGSGHQCFEISNFHADTGGSVSLGSVGFGGVGDCIH